MREMGFEKSRAPSTYSIENFQFEGRVGTEEILRAESLFGSRKGIYILLL